MKTLLQRNRFAGVVLLMLSTVFLCPAVLGQKKVFISSPYYNVDIGLNFTGQCGPENGAVFSQYGSVSSFNNIRFVASQTKIHPCWIESQGKVADFLINGEGSIVSFQICPDYDPEPQKATVKYGPVPFQPALRVMTKDEIDEYLESGTEIPLLPLASVVYFIYTDNFNVAKPELQWETEIGKGVVESRSAVFYVPIDQLGKGKAIELNVPYKDEGEKGMWNIRIFPLK